MNSNEIAPQPVKTPKELIAKMDLLIGAIHLLNTAGNDDPEYVGTVISRLNELHTDVDTIGEPNPVEADAIMRKMIELKLAVAKMSNEGEITVSAFI